MVAVGRAGTQRDGRVGVLFDSEGVADNWRFELVFLKLEFELIPTPKFPEAHHADAR